MSSARASAIWSNTLALIASHPWLGVGFGEFNFAWTLTPFPGRPTEFFDHTHNLPLQLRGRDWACRWRCSSSGCCCYALWRALGDAIATAARRGDGVAGPARGVRDACLLIGRAQPCSSTRSGTRYFLLPAAFAFGLCLGRPVASDAAAAPATTRAATPRGPTCIAAMLLIARRHARWSTTTCASSSIFAPPAGAAPLGRAHRRRAQRSWLFAPPCRLRRRHHRRARPARCMSAFERAPHYLLDTRLMMAWAKALAERGELDKARYLAARLREFRNDRCRRSSSRAMPTAGAPASAAAAVPVPARRPSVPLRGLPLAARRRRRAVG